MDWIQVFTTYNRYPLLKKTSSLFVPCSDSLPMNPDKKTLIPYIYNVSKAKS